MVIIFTMNNTYEFKQIEALIKNNNTPLFNLLKSHFETAAQSLVTTKKQKLFLILEKFHNEGRLSLDELDYLKSILNSKESNSTNIIDYEKYFSSLKTRTFLKKGFALVLMPFLVANTVDEVLGIKKDGVSFVKTKKGLLIFFETPLHKYTVYLYANVKLYEKLFNEYLLSLRISDKNNNNLLFGKEDQSFSNQIRNVRNKVENCFKSYIHKDAQENFDLTNRTLLAILKEDVALFEENFSLQLL